jgi:predicted outer membrane repeat protein
LAPTYVLVLLVGLQIAFSPSGSSSVFSVTGCTFDGNSAPSDGGAISLVPARRSSISMSTFSNNNATENGGAIYISPGDSTLPVILFKNSFENNNAFTASGGAVMADHYVDVRDCEFTHNKAGQSGGALIAFDQVDLVDSLFSGNSVPHMAGKQGGAIYLALTSRPTVKGVTFEENDAGEGGAIFTTSLAITVTESRFDDNTAISGAAVTVFTGSALIVSSTFESNIGDTIGALHTRADLVLTGSTFDLNEVTDIAGAGGAVNCLSAIPGNVPVSLTVTGSTFTDNTAHGRGGAIYSSGCKATISSCTFEGNGANVTLGGALGFQNGALTLMSSVFDMNEAADGGHVWTDDELTTSGNHFHEADADSGILLSTPLSPPNLSGNMYYGSGYSIKALLTPGQELAVTGSSAISGIWVDSGDLKLSLPTADPITIGKLRASTAHIHTSNSLVVTEGLIWGRTNITAATPGLTLTLTETSMSTFERPADYNTTGSRFLDGIVMHNHGTVHIDSVDQTWNDTLLATVPTTQDLNTCLHMANGAHFLAQPNSHTYLGYYCHVLGPVSSFFNASGHVYIDGAPVFLLPRNRSLLLISPILLFKVTSLFTPTTRRATRRVWPTLSWIRAPMMPSTS